ncbi:excinuclease ABC subunit B, partial [candidate division WWE3 bacterium CG_4_8_14_3_um_filter_42_11]
ELIDKLRLSATTSLLTRQDVIVVASVSCIYNIGSPIEYGKYLVTLKKGHEYRREALFRDLIRLRYERNDLSPKRGMYAVKG